MIIAILIGFFSGIIGGMGVGGGAILIPLITFFFNVEQKIAQSVNLLYFIPTAAAAVIIHVKNKKIEIKPLIMIIIFGVIGCIAGSVAALKIKSSLLGKMFGIFLIILSIREVYLFFKAKKQ